MRQMSQSALLFDWSRDDSAELKIVRAHRSKYKRMSAVLDENPAILKLAARDLSVLSRGARGGRKAVYTAENLLRALIVHTVEGEDLRGTVLRIAQGPFLQDFLRLGNRRVMDYSFLDKAFKAIRPETWKSINEALGAAAFQGGKISPAVVRLDSTVVETTIHYPTDSSLLWDSWRTLSRLLRQGRKLAPEPCPHRFHDRKVKRFYLRIVRYGRSQAKARRRLVKTCWKGLIARVRWIAAIAEEFALSSRMHPSFAVQGVGLQIEGSLPLIETVISTAERANLLGEKVPASERVFSIFEPHTELIRRGKARRPVEFGHVVVLEQTREKFISNYRVMEHRVPDPFLTVPSVEAHEKLFGSPPEVLTADHGFNPQAPVRAALEEKVKSLAIPRKLSDWAEVIGSAWQRFRAGIEGSISVLKRAFRLLRCPYRGFRSFASSIGMSIFCHNLALLARPPGK